MKIMQDIWKMNTTYNNLWKKLIDCGMSKTEMRIRAGISSSSLAKLTKGETVTTAIMEKICMAWDCDLDEILSKDAIDRTKKRKIYVTQRKHFLLKKVEESKG